MEFAQKNIRATKLLIVINFEYMSSKNAAKIHLNFALKAAEKAGRALYHTFRVDEPIIRGSSKEIKTIYDKLTDSIIKKALEKKFPEHSYLTEETGLVDKGGDYLWVIDPLDGTGNFVNHNPLFSVSIALWYKNKPILGVIEVPMLREKFWATLGGGAWHFDILTKRKKLARVSSLKDISKSYIIYCEGNEKRKERLVNLFSQNYKKAKEVRKIGSAAIELAWIGLGRAEAYYTTKISFWDIAAGLLFVKEAGGKLLHFNGQPYRWSDFTPQKQFDLLATNGKIKLAGKR